MVTETFTDYTTLSESLSYIVDYLLIEEVIGSALSSDFTVSYLTETKGLQLDMSTTTAVVFQDKEEIEWVGYGSLQNIRRAKVEADIRVNNNVGMDAETITIKMINIAQDMVTQNLRVNGDRVLYVKLINAQNLQKLERGIEWLEYVYEVAVLTNNFT